MNLEPLIVSSCYARKCHPETCCCSPNVYSVMHWKLSTYSWDTVYYAPGFYGTREECEKYAEKIKTEENEIPARMRRAY